MAVAFRPGTSAAAAAGILIGAAFFIVIAASSHVSAASESGEWTYVPSPNGAGTSTVFRSVAAIAPDDVWAVGASLEPGSPTLTAHWDGTEWTRIPGPSTGGITCALLGVAAVSSTDVWAVGYYTIAGGQPQTLIQHWNGTAWSIVDSPFIYGGTSLSAVDVVSANDIWAVGYRVGGAPPGPTVGTLAVHWDGSSWEIVETPNVGTRSHDLRSVSAIASNDVWAVGYWRSVGGPYTSLTMHWNGSAWSVVSSPTGPGGSELAAVDGVSANDVWASGAYADLSGAEYAFFLHWTGSSWTQVPSPGGVQPCIGCRGGLEAIASNDVWAAGGTFAHWDGNAWTLVPGAEVPGASSVQPYALSALNSGDVWAVGSYSSGSSNFTLTEHWEEQGLVTPTARPSRTATTPASTPTGGVQTPVATSTRTSTADPTSAATASATATCSIEFSDVPPASPFYPYVQCLACRGILSGYSDGTFRPLNDVTRGQAAKIIASARGYSEPIPPSRQTFTDVPPSNPFWLFVERAALHGAIGGYSDGTFRPFNNMTRGQFAKVDSEVAGYNDPIPAARQTFTDVPPSNPFWLYIERVTLHGVVGGYSDGTFRPFNNVTRGQAAKIVSSTFYLECGTR